MPLRDSALYGGCGQEARVDTILCVLHVIVMLITMHPMSIRAVAFFVLCSVAVLGLGSSVAFLVARPSATLAATNTVNVWWPSASATLSGVQPFKAMLQSLPVEQYTMYWQVDGG